MPYRFAFYGDDNNSNENGPLRKYFECDLQCQQCSAVSQSSGQRCRKRVCIGVPLCWQHLLSQHNLRIKQSTIAGAGKGVFVDTRTGQNEIVFRKQRKVTDYDGEIFDRAELERRYGAYTAPYAMTLTTNRIEDAACRRGVGAMINHTSNARKINVNLSHHRAQKGVIMAAKNIRNGDELLTSYGNEYRLNEPGSRYTTRPARGKR